MARWTTGSATAARKRAASNSRASAKLSGLLPRVWGESEVGARRHSPRRLEDRGDFGHEPCLQGRDGIRVLRRSVQHILQQEGLLSGGRHTLAMDRVEAAERVSDRQHAAGQMRQPFEMLPGADREAIVANASRRLGVTGRVVPRGGYK